MRLRYWNLLLTLIITVATIVWAVRLDPLSPHVPDFRQPETPGTSLPPLTSKVVFVIIDGLRYDVSEGMPCLQGLRAQGGSARSIAALPSISQPMWTALVTGATPELTDSGLMNVADEDMRRIRVDQIFGVARRAGRATALAGQGWWSRMIPPDDLSREHIVEGFDVPGDTEAAQAGAEFARDPSLNLVLVYFGDYDEIAHDYGALSAEARASAARIDADLCTLLASVDLAKTVVIVTADHGHIDAGGHGGDEPAVLETPFVMAGPRVRAGTYPNTRNVDIAPTIAALIGAPLPRAAEGRILYDWLDVSAADKAQGQVALAEQKLAFADAYLAGIGGAPVPDALRQRVSQAGAVLAAGDSVQPDALATAVVDDIAAHVAQERAGRIQNARLLALPFALLGLAAVALVFVANWRTGERLALVLAVVGAVAFHAVFLLRGHAYSLSALIGEMYLATTILAGAALALLIGALPLLVLARRQPAGERAAAFFASLAAFCAALVALPFALALVANAANGSLGTWNLIVPFWHFLMLLSAVQTAVLGLFGLIALLAAWAVWAISRARRRSA